MLCADLDSGQMVIAGNGMLYMRVPFVAKLTITGLLSHFLYTAYMETVHADRQMTKIKNHQTLRPNLFKLQHD